MDREKVIKGLEHCIKTSCESCPYNATDVYNSNPICLINEMLSDALALLKEQEAVVPYQHDAVWLCGNCGKEVVGWDDDIDGKEYRYPFCRQCGQAVKWE